MKSKIVLRLALALSFWLGAGSSKADSFAGTGVGPIPDGPADGGYGLPLTVTFNVTNLQTSVQSVSLTISMYHPWLGDLDVQLTSPTGTNFIIFSRVGPPNSGLDSGGMLGTSNGSSYTNYTFVDSATNTLLSYNPSGDNVPIPSGSYRTSSAGPNNEVATSFATDSGFIGLTPEHANGTWKLTFQDGGWGGIGAVQSATLVLGQGSNQQPPQFTRIGVTNGIVTLILTGPNSQGYRLYTTTNLAPPQSWSTIGGGTFDATTGKATNSTSAVGPKCFYRVSSP